MFGRLIDDDKSFREALAESIRDFGYDVVEASGAQAALNLINEVDAAFLDLKMPGTSGIEFLRQAKPSVPVIVLTAFADSANTIEAIRLGAFDHLTKPIGRADLQRVLAEALKKSQIAPRGDYLPSGDDLIGLDGAVLDNGTIVHFPPPVGTQYANLFQVGAPLAAAGYGIANTHGRSLEAASIGPSADHLQTVNAIDDRPPRGWWPRGTSTSSIGASGISSRG